MTTNDDGSKVPPVIEKLLKSLVVTEKAVALYPPSSNIPRDTAEESARILSEALEERPEIRFVITKQGLYCDDLPLFSGESAYSAFATELYNRQLADVRFHAGASPKDIVSFLSLLKYTPDEIEEAGGFESRLWDLGVATITVTEARLSVVDSGALDVSGTEKAPGYSRNEIDEILAAAYGGRSRDQLTITRFLGDHMGVAEYLTLTYVGSGTTPDVVSAAERFSELAEVAYEAGGETGRAALMHHLDAAFQELEPSIQEALLAEHILPEARTNEALAAVVRQMDIDSVCEIIVRDAGDDAASREGLARAIRNLSLISMADREEVVESAGNAMLSAGFDQEFVSDVLETAAPSRLTVTGSPAAGEETEQPAEAIFKLMDMAPAAHREVDSDDDPGVEELKAEARRGITDGDVIIALVALVAMDPSEDHFASTMSMLEDSLDVLIERGEIDVAADAADALEGAAQNPDLTPEQRLRLRKAIGRFTKPEDIKAVAEALRLYAPTTREHAAAQRLLEALGPLAIEPLLEQLADEPDMGVRKSLIELLSTTAATHISELGAYVTDSRWYVVRNVVSILGTTKSSAVLQYLERTVRHSEPRVRREVIRALSNIGDRLAHELIMTALTDEDAQNVQLAARYLGASGVKAAVPALEQVARGEGRGNRTPGPRVEAIEALGRMRATEALPTLESLAGRRSLIGSNRGREVRAAAEAAIARIKAPSGGAR